MKFPYKKYSDEIYRPIIPVVISYKNVSVGYEVIVDSGADGCMFDASLAEVLRIDLEQCEVLSLSGITGMKEPYFVEEVELQIGSAKFSCKVGFLRGMAELGYGVVGQRGFFERFVIKFDYASKLLHINERR